MAGRNLSPAGLTSTSAGQLCAVGGHNSDHSFGAG
jgi:hypothetical protein